jgi:hypothetical protein
VVHACHNLLRRRVLFDTYYNSIKTWAAPMDAAHDCAQWRTNFTAGHAGAQANIAGVAAEGHMPDGDEQEGRGTDELGNNRLRMDAQ